VSKFEAQLRQYPLFKIGAPTVYGATGKMQGRIQVLYINRGRFNSIL
jgi:hypothetical protein